MFLHIDINSYFATLLQQETPSLRGKPVGVVKDVGRTCIIAASNEAKLRGVRTGTSSGDAQARCPEIILLPADFALYGAATKRLVALFANISPSAEIFSLDEAFIPYDELRRIHPDPVVLAKQVQAGIKTELGEWLSCNIGVGPSRLLAKMASETAPKGSVTLITPEVKQTLLMTTPFLHVCGVGWRLEKRLAALGVTRPFQINFIPKQELERHFGLFWSTELLRIANGEETTHLQRLALPAVATKSVGRSITLFSLMTSRAEEHRVLCNLASEVMHKARVTRLAGRRISIGLIGQQKYWRRHVTLQSPIRQTRELLDWVGKLYADWDNQFPLIRFAVHLSLLTSWDTVQLPLLHTWWQREKAETAVDVINHKYGIYTLRSGRLLNDAVIIRPEITGFLGDKAYQLAP